MTTPTPQQLAQAWLDAFNAHDVKRLVALYDAQCTHTSPRLRATTPQTGGKISGHAALEQWWTGALQKTPSLRYEATAITASEHRVVLEYTRHADGESPSPVAETFEVRDGKIIASQVYLG